METVVDVAFPLSGKSLPLDHGYSLFGAVSRLVPRLHKEAAWGIHPVYGKRAGPGVLSLLRQSHLTVRLAASEIGALMPLTGTSLDVAGNQVSLGIPRVYPLKPRPALRARFVTVKSFKDDAGKFGEALRRQMDAMEIASTASIDVGTRRVMKVSSHVIVGFSVAVDGLTADESLRLQIRVSPAAASGTTSTGITGDQGTTR